MRRQILLVEDNADLRETTAELLTLNGYEVLIAADGAEGCNIAAAILPGAILSDVRMPGLSGYELIERLRGGEKTRNIPVILTSANFDHQYIPPPGQPSAIAYLPKPFDEEELLACLKKVLRNDA